MKKCEKCFAGIATRHVNGMYLCDSCAFQEENAQCYKCQMYLPKAELVMWRGQLYCQYCLMDIRDEEARAKHGEEEHKKEHIKYDHKENKYRKDYIKNEYCERCGTTLYTVYVINGRKLCKNCADEVMGEARDEGIRMRPIKYKIRNKPLVVSVFELIGKGVMAIYNKAFGRKRKKKEK